MSRLPRWLRPGDFLRSVSILAGGTAVGQLVTIAVSPLLSRLFGAESFGVLAVYTAVLGVTTAVGSLRLEQAIGLPRSRQAGFNVFVLAALSSLVTSVVVGVIIFAAPGLLFQENQNIPALVSWLFPFGVALSSLYQALSMWALRTRGFRSIAGTRIAQAISGSAVQILSGLLAFGSVGLVAGNMIGHSAGIGTLIANTVRGKKLRRPRRRELAASIRRYRKFPLLATPAALLNSLSLQIPVLLMTPAFGIAVVGQYFLANRIAFAPLALIGGSIGQVFYSDATSIGKSQPTKLIKLILSTSAKSFMIGLVPGIALATLSPILFPIVFGSEWMPAGHMSQALTIMLVANFALSPVAQIFLIIEKQLFSIGVNMARLLVAVCAISLPAALGSTPELTVLTYSCTMAAFYFATLLVALLLLRSMQRNTSADRA